MILSFGQKIIVAAIIAVITASLTRFIVYRYTGWKSFSMKKGENFQITDPDPELVSKIKFRDCIFKIEGANGETRTLKVDSILNKMVSAYAGNKNTKYVFKLDDPGLSVYSFVITGFNDSKDNQPDPAVWDDENENVKVTLTGYYKLIN
jgi:hypothetical protein